MERPAYYAARPGGWRDFWTILHPPYTAWHLSYVVIGACLAPHTNGMRLVATEERDFVAGRQPSEMWEITADEWHKARALLVINQQR